MEQLQKEELQDVIILLNKVKLEEDPAFVVDMDEHDNNFHYKGSREGLRQIALACLQACVADENTPANMLKLNSTEPDDSLAIALEVKYTFDEDDINTTSPLADNVVKAGCFLAVGLVAVAIIIGILKVIGVEF